MDQLAVHPYPNPNASPPPAPDNAGYQNPGFYGIPQLDRVRQAVYDAFNGTNQPTTVNGLGIVIDENRPDYDLWIGSILDAEGLANAPPSPAAPPPWAADV